MPDLLLELFSEEIPARMQGAAAKDLERLVVGALSDRGLLFEGAKSFAGPRRLTLVLAGLPARQPDVKEEKKGPRVGAPEKAIEGFLRSAGVTLDQCQKQSDAKGEFYVAVIERKGRATGEVLAEILPEAFAKLPWPKSMRFPGSAVRWVRPLHAIVCTFDGEVVPFEFAGVTSGNTTFGHRFLSKGPIEVRRFEDYERKLREAHVIVDPQQRWDIIQHETTQSAFALGLGWQYDSRASEVVGLAEWPVVLIGTIDEQFMELPREILETTMWTHQRYFNLLKPEREDADDDSAPELANKFALVANMIAADGGKEIVAGNERVLRARLSDAKFFWDQDRKTKLADRVDALRNIVFHAKLGTQYERVTRIQLLAGQIAKAIGADVGKAERAAWLCKSDLTTGVVGEFPELQGAMGRYYHLEQYPHDTDVADAIRDHYRPLGPSDAVPVGSISVAVAIADKLDTLINFFAIREFPTGSSDPYALRRAALGVIRIIMASGLRLNLLGIFHATVDANIGFKQEATFDDNEAIRTFRILLRGREVAHRMRRYQFAPSTPLREEFIGYQEEYLAEFEEFFLGFFADRLKVALREKGTRHDLIDAVFSLGNEDDLVRLVARVEALQAFLKTDDGANLLTAYRRAANILRDEEKRDKTSFDGEPDPEAFVAAEEKALFVELATASELIRAEVERERFVEAMGVMARLRAPVDAFFDKVTVNDKNPALRQNRLKLLSRLRATLHLVADFSKIEG